MTAREAGLRDYTLAFVERSVKLRARRAALGLIWPALAPLALLALYVFVFRTVFDVRIPHYAEFLFAGLLPWSYFAQAAGAALTSISVEPELVRRASFPYEMLPIATCIALFLPFLVTLTGFVVYLAITGRLEPQLLPLLIVPLTSLLFFAFGLAVLLALIDIRTRDLRYLLGNLLTVWFFLVPIVYRHSMTPRPLRFLRSVDPMNLIVGQFRDILFWGHISRPEHLALMVVLTALWFTGALAIFRRFSPSIPKLV